MKRKAKFVDTDEYIRCRLCGKKFKRIMVTHIRYAHNIEFEEYKILFPDTPLISKKTEKLIKETHWVATHTGEFKEKMSEIGKESMTSEKQKKMSESATTSEVNVKRSNTLKVTIAKMKKENPEEFKKKYCHSEGIKRSWAKTDPEVKKERMIQLCNSALKAMEDPEVKKRKKENHKKYWNSLEGLKQKARNSQITKERWKDPEYRKEMSIKLSVADKKYLQSLTPKERDERMRIIMLGAQIKPNKPEKLLSKILDNLFPNEFKYVGNGEVVINGKNPDFFNINGKKQIIELFGNYWHSKKKTGHSKEQEEQDRIVHFKNYGYKTLIIWERELKNTNKVKEKLQEFCQLANAVQMQCKIRR